jgi:hypothetical protein
VGYEEKAIEFGLAISLLLRLSRLLTTLVDGFVNGNEALVESGDDMLLMWEWREVAEVITGEEEEAVRREEMEDIGDRTLQGDMGETPLDVGDLMGELEELSLRDMGDRGSIEEQLL